MHPRVQALLRGATFAGLNDAETRLLRSTLKFVCEKYERAEGSPHQKVDAAKKAALPLIKNFMDCIASRRRITEYSYRSETSRHVIRTPKMPNAAVIMAVSGRCRNPSFLRLWLSDLFLSTPVRRQVTIGVLMVLMAPVIRNHTVYAFACLLLFIGIPTPSS